MQPLIVAFQVVNYCGVRCYMDDIDARKNLFAWYGAAMYAAQCFEVELVVLLLGLKVLRDPGTEPHEYNRLDITLSKKTLGALIKELKKHCGMTQEFEEILIGYRNSRNYLAHEFFYKNEKRMRTREGIDTVTAELQDMECQLREADSVATIMSKNVRRMCGIDEDMLQAQVRKILDSERR